MAFLLDYGTDALALLLVLLICFLLYKLYYHISIRPYINQIKKALDDENYSEAKSLITYALAKRPGKKEFLKLQELYQRKISKPSNE